MIDEQFPTREAAEKKAKEINEHCPTQHFCPQTNEMCRKDCVCFVRARIADQSDFPHDPEGPFEVFMFYCANPMLGQTRR